MRGFPEFNTLVLILFGYESCTLVLGDMPLFFQFINYAPILLQKPYFKPEDRICDCSSRNKQDIDIALSNTTLPRQLAESKPGNFELAQELALESLHHSWLTYVRTWQGLPWATTDRVRSGSSNLVFTELLTLT